MIQIDRLSKSFKEKKVLNQLSLTLKTGEITAIVGPNACGKTTLIRSILGLVIPDSGTIAFDGVPQDSAGQFRRAIGYMPQVPAFPNNLTARELFDMLEDLRQEKGVFKQELIDYFSMESRLDQPLELLSGGTKQKMAAIMAFMFNAPLVILDEPTAGLDPLSIIRFKELLFQKAKAGTTIIFTSHIMTEVQHLAQNLVFMTEGQLIYSGEIAPLLQKMNVTHLEAAITQLFEEHGS